MNNYNLRFFSNKNENFIGNYAYNYGKIKATNKIKLIRIVNEFDKINYRKNYSRFNIEIGKNYKKCLLKFGLIDFFSNFIVSNYDEFNSSSLIIFNKEKTLSKFFLRFL